MLHGGHPNMPQCPGDVQECLQAVPGSILEHFRFRFLWIFEGFGTVLVQMFNDFLIHFGFQNESQIEAKILQQLTKHNETPCPTLGQRAQSKDGRSDREAICGRFAHTAAAE